MKILYNKRKNLYTGRIRSGNSNGDLNNSKGMGVGDDSAYL